MSRQPSAEYVREFASSLSDRYRSGFDPECIAQHAAVAAGRGGRLAAAGRFHASRRYGDGICVVAEDRPGLLAAISAALVKHGLDVIHGEAHTRTTGARNREAVDLFWVRDDPSKAAPSRVSDAVLAKLGDTLQSVLAGHRDLQSVFPGARVDRPGDASVKFIEGAAGELTTLEVEAEDRPGLLLALAAALRDQRVQIVSSEVHTDEGRARDRFVIEELTGSAIRAERRLAIQVAVLSALGSRSG